MTQGLNQAERVRRQLLGPAAEGERARQLAALRLASPKRAEAGAIVRDQADAAHLPLFIAADEPRLL